MRKLLIISTLALLSLSIKGQIDTVNVGTGANTGTGDPLRTAFLKVNVGLNLLNNAHIYTITGISDTVATKQYVRSLMGSAMSYPASGIPLSTGSAWGTSITNNSVNWDSAYAARLRWSGTATGLTAATGRTSLGGTTVGQAFFTLANPSAIRIPIIQADNSITATATTGTGNVVLSTSPTLSGTVALGTGSLTMTGSLAATGSRVLKGWFTDLEVTNLPTVNGAALKTALSLTATDVGLGNVTNESKATMFTNPTFTGTATIPTPFTLGAVSVTANGPELNVLDNIPATLTATELGYVDGVTSSIQSQINALSAGSSASWNIVNVKDHGATGDGTTPDADSIKAQIADNTILFFPSGTYLIDTILILTSPVNFKMIGENGTVFLVNESTNGTGNYGCIRIVGVTDNVEISKINFRVTASYTNTDHRPPIIMVANNISSTTNLSINNCKFHAPSINMNAVYMNGNTGLYNNIKFIDNEVDSIGRCGIEYYEDSYANAYDSSSFHHVIIKGNYFSNTGLYGIYGMPVSIAGNDVEISDNHFYNHRSNQTVELGHSYRSKVHDNIFFSRYSSNGVGMYRGYQFTITDNVMTFPNFTAAAIGLNECQDFSVNNNTIRAYQNAITFLGCSSGVVAGNIIRANRACGIWIDNENTYLLVRDNKITMIDATGQTGAIRISKSDNTAMSNTYGNIIQDNTIITGETGTNFVVHNVNRSLNTVIDGSLVKTKVLTFGLTGDTQADQLFDITQANVTEQVLTFADILPSNCRIIAFEMVCVTAVSGSTDINMEAGISSSGNELIESASCNTLNEVRGVIDAAKLPAIAMYWNTSVDQYSFRSIYISATPAANWNTISAGKWKALLTYVDYRYK